MPRFFFHVISARGRFQDVEGSILPGLEEARGSAIEDARSLMSGAILDGVDISSRRIEICTEGGTVLAIVPFRSAIDSIE